MNGAGTFYDNPLFTLNAFAFSGEGEPDRRIDRDPRQARLR